MRAADRVIAATLAATLAWMIGAALDLPVWTTWTAGDRTDIAAVTFALVWVLTRRPTLTQPHEGLDESSIGEGE